MRIPSFFKSHQSRSFSFENRYYDARKEKLKQRIDSASVLKSTEEYNANFNFRTERRRQEGYVTRVIFLIAFVSISAMVILLYYLSSL